MSHSRKFWGMRRWVEVASVFVYICSCGNMCRTLWLTGGKCFARVLLRSFPWGYSSFFFLRDRGVSAVFNDCLLHLVTTWGC